MRMPERLILAVATASTEEGLPEIRLSLPRGQTSSSSISGPAPACRGAVCRFGRLAADLLSDGIWPSASLAIAETSEA